MHVKAVAVRHCPESWTREQVSMWLKERVYEYGLDPDLPTRFPMNGRGLCMLDKEDFRRRAPDTGDVLYNALQSLAFTYSPSKTSFAHNLSDMGVPQWVRANEDIVSSNVCTRYTVSPLPAQIFRMHFDHIRFDDQENEPLNLKVTKPSPQRLNHFTPHPLLDHPGSGRTFMPLEVTDQSRFTSTPSFKGTNDSDRPVFHSSVFSAFEDMVKPFHPSGLFSLPPHSSFSRSDSNTSSSNSPLPPLGNSHLCTLPTPPLELSSTRYPTPPPPPQLPLPPPSSSSSPPPRGASSPLEQPGQLQSFAAALVAPLPDLSSLVSLSNTEPYGDSTLTSASSPSTLIRPSVVMSSLEERRRSYTCEADQYPIQVSTTCETKAEAQHRKMSLNLSTSDRLLWKFLAELLDSNKTNCIIWEDRQQLIFQISDPNELAELWGEEKCKPGMTYEKLSRALRYYYKMNILEKVPGKRLTYRFLTSPQFIKKGKRGAKPGVPHKRRNCVEPSSSNTTSENFTVDTNKS